MSDDYRQIFYFELVPGRFVSISMKGPFDSDMWSILKDFLDRHQTHSQIAQSDEVGHE